MKLPSYEEGIDLFKQYTVPKNIQHHCEKVCELATFMAEKLKEKGIPIDVELTRIGALFHDWMKAVTIDDIDKVRQFGYEPTEEEIKAWEELRKRFKGKRECEVAYELLKDKYPELAELLMQEENCTWYQNSQDHRSWEVKVIHYADWRVFGTRVVPLTQRIDDLSIRYHDVIMEKGPGLWKKATMAEFQHEQEICKAAGIMPEELK